MDPLLFSLANNFSILVSRFQLLCDHHRFDVLVAPARRVRDEADDEEHPGEGLHGAADGEDGAADAAAAADGQQGEQVSDHLLWIDIRIPTLNIITG